MSTDSLNQLRQALGVVSYYDWHPPVMALVWSIGIHLTGAVGSMLVFQLLSLWASLYLLAIYIYKTVQSRLLSLIPLGLGVLPFISNISGVIWKDVHMAFALLLSVVLGLLYPYIGKKVRLIVTALATLALMYAVMLRYNAILAVVPVAFYLVSGISKKVLIRVGYVLAVIALGVVANVIISTLLDVRKSNPTSSIMLDDVVHSLSVQDIQALQINPQTKQDLIDIQLACDRKDIMLHAYLFCSTPEQRDSVQYVHHGDLRRAWGDVVIHHGFEYMRYRLKMFGTFIFTPEKYEYVYHQGIDPNDLGQEVLNPGAERFMREYVVGVFVKDLGILYRPYFWLLVTVVITLVARRYQTRHAHAIYALAASSMAYILGYFPFVIAGDYRYIYWSVIATCIAGILLVVDWKLASISGFATNRGRHVSGRTGVVKKRR